jgi:hypothetical protein
LIGGDAAAAGQLPGARLASGVGEPWPLRQSVQLGAHPDVQLVGVGIKLLHQLARLDGRFQARRPAGQLLARLLLGSVATVMIFAPDCRGSLSLQGIRHQQRITPGQPARRFDQDRERAALF